MPCTLAIMKLRVKNPEFHNKRNSSETLALFFLVLTWHTMIYWEYQMRSLLN